MNPISYLFKMTLIILISTIFTVCHADVFPSFKFSLSCGNEIIWEGILPSNQKRIAFDSHSKQSIFLETITHNYPLLLTRELNSDSSGYTLLLSKSLYKKSERIVQKMPSTNKKSEEYTMILPIFETSYIPISYSKVGESSQAFKFFMTDEKDNHLFVRYYTLTLSEIKE